MSDSGSEDGSTWDVEKYRVDYESEEHWGLRKVMMVLQERFEILIFLFCLSGFYGTT